MCVFLGSMCLKLLLRDVFENLKCWLNHWLTCMLDCIHICVFSFLEKLFLSNLDSFSTPSRHLAIYWAFQLPLIAILIASQQLGGSIEISSGSSIASRQLVDWSRFFLAFCWIVPRQILDSFICWRLFYRHLAQHLSRQFYLSRFTRLLFKREFRFPSHFSRSLSWQTCLSNSQNSLTHSKPHSQVIFKLSQIFSSLGEFLIFHLHAFHVLKPRFWGFWKILGFFKIDEFSLKFWDGFLLK